MGGIVELPVWFVAVAAILALVGLLDRLLVPSVRWFLRRRVNRVIDDLNDHIHLRIQPFKLNKRASLIDRLIYDQDVIKAAEAWAIEHDEPRASAIERVRVYAKEIVPAFNAYAYFRVGARAARGLSKILYRVRLGFSDDDNLRKIDPDAAVVFVMNHRSNMDYVLVTYLAASNSALSYAVGEWARIWPLQSLIRAMGAYFIRRDSGDPLYRKVLSRYVHIATSEGVTQAVFPEGGLSRDGKLRPTRLGLLSYMVSDFDPERQRDIVFVPVGLNYDRVMEDRNLTKSLQKETGQRHWRFGTWKVVKYILRGIGLSLRGRWFRFGYASVGFGPPVSLRDYLKRESRDFSTLSQKARFTAIEKLGDHLMTEVGQVIPALPVSLAAQVFTMAGNKPISELELKSRIFSLASDLEAAGVHVHIPRQDRDYAVGAGLRMLTLRRLVVETEEGLYLANPDEQVLLNYYANSIAHLIKPHRARKSKKTAAG